MKNKKTILIIALIFIIYICFIPNFYVFAQSCGSISCPPGYYLSHRCCDSGSCNMNNNDGNPQTGCDGYTGCNSLNPYTCCECTPIQHPCGSCIPSSCGGGVVSLPSKNLALNDFEKDKNTENRKMVFNNYFLILGNILQTLKFLNINTKIFNILYVIK